MRGWRPTEALAACAAALAVVAGGGALWIGATGLSAELAGRTGGLGLGWLAGMAPAMALIAAIGAGTASTCRASFAAWHRRRLSAEACAARRRAG